MANRHRGQIELKAGERTLTLQFGINQVIELEEKMGKEIAEIGASLASNPSLKSMRLIVQTAMKKHQPDTTEQDAGDAMDEAGFTETLDAVITALTAAFGDLAGGAGKAEPAAEADEAGTGEPSTATH